MRTIYWNIADVDDYKKFPEVQVPNKAPVFNFIPGSKNIVLPKEYFEKYQTSDLDDFLKQSGSLAFIVIRNDTLLKERYFNGYSRSSIFPSFSVAKSFVSALTGIAVQEGWISNVQDPVTKYIPDMKDKRFREVSLENLLNMRAGLCFDESNILPGAALPSLYYGRNLAQLVKNMHIENPPDSVYQYQSVNTQILAMVLENASGKKMEELLAERIWQPLGMEFPASWSIDSKKNGNVKAFCCLNARAIDFAKFGRLYLNNGYWDGVQIIPVSWIERTRQIVNDSRDSQNYPYSYH